MVTLWELSFTPISEWYSSLYAKHHVIVCLLRFLAKLMVIGNAVLMVDTFVVAHSIHF